MSLDTCLTWANVVAPFVLAMMGIWIALKPPEKEDHWKIITAFALVGLIGVGISGWLASRADYKTSKDASTLQTGLNTVDTHVKSGFQGLHRDLTGAKPVAHNAEVAKSREIPIPHARIKIANLVFADAEDGSGDKIVRAFYENHGQATGFTPAIAYNSYIGPAIQQSEWNEKMLEARKAALEFSPPRNSEIEVGQTNGYAAVARLKRDDWTKVLSGEITYYSWIALASTDGTLPRNRAFIAEHAVVVSGSSEQDVKIDKFYEHKIKIP